MTDVLLVYGTTDGHTAKVAKRLADDLRALALTVDVFDAAGVVPPPDAYHSVVVAASVRAGRYPSPVIRWVRAHSRPLATKRSAFLSVCLGVLQHSAKVDADLDAVMRRFFEQTGWIPHTHKVVAGALLYTEYNILTRWLMRRMVRKAGGDTDTSRDFEYTSWAEVKGFAREVADLAERRLVVRCPIPHVATSTGVSNGAALAL